MNGFKWAILAWYALSALLTVSAIGKPRKPLGTDVAVATLVILGVLAFLVVQS